MRNDTTSENVKPTVIIGTGMNVAASSEGITGGRGDIALGLIFSGQGVLGIGVALRPIEEAKYCRYISTLGHIF